MIVVYSISMSFFPFYPQFKNDWNGFEILRDQFSEPFCFFLRCLGAGLVRGRGGGAQSKPRHFTACQEKLAKWLARFI